MARRNVVFAASENYMPGVKALLRSFAYYHNLSDYNVVVLSVGLTKESLEWVSQYAHLVPVPPGPQGQIWDGQYPRYEYASTLTGATMLLDADMFFVDEVDQWFRLAEDGYIVAGARGMNVRYEQGYADIYGDDILNVFNPMCVCNVPIVLDGERHGEVFYRVYMDKIGKPRASDLDLQSIWLYRLGKHKDMIVLPPQVTTGVHHFQLKLDTGIEARDGKLMTRDGLVCKMVHGKWWNPGWRDDLMPQMRKYAKDEKIVHLAEFSKQLLYNEFLLWSKDDGIPCDTTA